MIQKCHTHERRLYPRQSCYPQRRHKQRYDLEFPIKIVSGNADIAGRATSIGLLGMSVIMDSDQPLDVGATVIVIFHDQLRPFNIEICSCVRWRNDTAYGLQFLGFRPEDARALRRFITHEQCKNTQENLFGDGDMSAHDIRN